MNGFTGINWDQRTSEQLASALGDGPGPGPLVEAGLAWAQLSADLAGAGVEYGVVLERLGLHWRSTQASALVDRLTRLAPWFADAAVEAAQNAARAEAQAAAVTVARVTMPNLAEVGFIESMRETSRAAGSVVPIIGGVVAHLERAAHEQHMRAARVMQAYETATEPVSQPWASVRQAPNLVSATPLTTEQAAAHHKAEPAALPKASDPIPPAPFMGAFGGLAPAAAQEKLKYVQTRLAAGDPEPEPVASPAPSASSTVGSPAGAPIAPAAAIGAGDRTIVRAADHSDGSVSADVSGGATESDVTPTWNDVAAADRPMVQPTVAPDDVDTRYTSETLLLRRGGVS